MLTIPSRPLMLLQVTHDARLISDLDCEVWVAAGDGTLHLHSGGFSDYRRSILREIVLMERRAEAVAAAKARERAESRALRGQKVVSRRRAQQEKKEAQEQALKAAVLEEGDKSVELARLFETKRRAKLRKEAT